MIKTLGVQRWTLRKWGLYLIWAGAMLLAAYKEMEYVEKTSREMADARIEKHEYLQHGDDQDGGEA